jgi:putative membrane protein
VSEGFAKDENALLLELVEVVHVRGAVEYATELAKNACAARLVRRAPDDVPRHGTAAIIRPMYTLLHLAILTGTILLLARVLPTVHVKSPGTAVLVAIVFSVLNWGVGWLIRALLFVPGILTLGLLFLVMPFIVNAVILWLTDKVLHAFEIDDAKSLFLSAGAITLANAVLIFVLRH